MTSRIYKSAQGKNIDIGALALKNEQMLAVSPGAKLNARGDVLDSNNRVVDKKSKQVQRQITQTTQAVNTSAAPIATTSRVPKSSPASVKETVSVTEVVDTVIGLDDVVESAQPTSNEGLAAAIARSKNKKAK